MSGIASRRQMVALLLASNALLMGNAEPDQKPRDRQEQTPNKRDNQKTTIPMQPGSPAATPQADGARDSGVECQRGADNRSSNLCAEWKAADAAADAAQWSYWQMIAGWGSVMVGFVTLLAAVAAAKYARDAAGHTKRGADASVDAKEVAQVQATSHLFLREVTLTTRVDGDYFLDVVVSNSGNTPAEWVKCIARFKTSVLATPFGPTEYIQRSVTQGFRRNGLEGRQVAAGQDLPYREHHPVTIPFNPVETAPDWSEHGVSIDIALEWLDVFGKWHNTNSVWNGIIRKGVDYIALEQWKYTDPTEP